jgi:uracil phosphoribosyltransferase
MILAILRSSIGMVDNFKKLVSSAGVDYVELYRDECNS